MNKMNKTSEEETVSQISRRKKREARRFVKQVHRSAERTKGYQASVKLPQYLKYLLEDYGDSKWIPACNAPARLLLSRHIWIAMLNMYRTKLQPNGYELYHLTVAFPQDRTGDRDTLIDWANMRKRVASMMRLVSKDFIGAGEIDITINEKCVEDGKSKGRDLCPHFHILFWTTKEIAPIKLGEQLSKRFPADPYGMKVVKITRCAGTDADVARMATTQQPPSVALRVIS